MSRIGKKPVAVPKGVQVSVSGQKVTVKGPKGELAITLIDDVSVEQGPDGVVVKPRQDTKRGRSMWGMSRTLVQNLMVGVTEGYTETLEIQGVGYRAALRDELQLQVGYSHDVNYDIPAGIKVECPKPTEIVISGIDKQKVGQVAAELRSWRPPEPYQGKGVRYRGEFILRKEGKKK